MSAAYNSMMSSVTESGELSACGDSLQPAPLDDINIKSEEEDLQVEEQQNSNEPPSIAMADGTIIAEPNELDILHALDQKINRLERMTVGIFEIIRHLGVQVHGVSNHLMTFESKIEQMMQGSSINMGNISVGQAPTQSLSFDHHQPSVMDGMNQYPNQEHAYPIQIPHPNHPPHQHMTMSTDSSTRRLSWNERFEELKRYRESNGHCDVPQIYDTGLGTWVSAQRSQFKRYIVGKTSSMTHQRKSALDKLGFSWSLRKRFSWDERYAELRHYSETHNGSCDVPNEGDYKPLWTWCQNQKQAYKRGREGKSHPVPSERVTMMEQIGFRWATTSGDTSYLQLSSPTEDSTGSQMSDSDDICSEIGEL